MGFFDWLFGRNRGHGRIYCGNGVSPAHSRVAEDAVSANRYSVFASTQDRSRAVLILATAPPLVAIISREPSFSGGAPDMIITAVYDPGGDPRAFAREIDLD